MPDSDTSITIVQKWKLPKALREISGLAYIDSHRFACIQDEKGIIYIYNSVSKLIEKQIRFARAGDFEGIAVKDQTAFVIRADGRLFEINLQLGKKSSIKHKTNLTRRQDIEGICYNRKNNRLLLVIKNDEPGKTKFKGIYAFDLQTMKLHPKPVYKIDLQHTIFHPHQGKLNKTIRPSEIDIHPLTNELYILDGPKSRLLILHPNGNIKKLIHLGKKFHQPEGITFSPEGNIFISNEGKRRKANIFQIAIVSVS